MIRAPHTRDHLKRHVLPARPLDPPRGPVPTRVRVQQKGHQHLRVIRSTTGSAQPIRLPEPIKVHLINGTKHRPHQVLLRQPLSQRRRHQQQLTTIDRYEISSHPRSVLNPPDSTDIPTASQHCSREVWRGRTGKAIVGHQQARRRPMPAPGACYARGEREQQQQHLRARYVAPS